METTLQVFLQKWWVLVLISLWSIPWKGVALWKAAGNRQKKWFVVLFLVNTLAILEIIYIFHFSKKNKAKEGETQ